MDWPSYEAEITKALAERDPGEAWVLLFDCQALLFESIRREQDMARCRLLALTAEAEHRVHVCDGEPEPPVATLEDVGQAVAAGDYSGVLGHAFGLWLHVWRCAVRAEDYATLARLAFTMLAHVRFYPAAQLIPAVPLQF
ncbi:hypothetical protein ACQP2T_63565 (plasmid) [Nonomuraea sp. CA-143628]|uniref:hypothetical protein n=1 Tax=Nonomuraea sp. CA-143628 TaxID=3239997 RepID=UPI003D8CF56C